MKKLEKIKNIEFLRFLFAIMIVFGHIIHICVYYSRLYSDYTLYRKYAEPVVDAFLCVEYFFIMAGFFLFFHLENKNDSTMKFSIGKFIRLWPLLAFYVILYWILSLFHIVDFDSYGNFVNLFFLYSILPSVYSVNNAISWFICSYFWCIIILHYSYRVLTQKIFNLGLVLVVLYSFTLILNWKTGQIPGCQTKIINGISGGLLRASAGFGLGYFLGMFWDYISDTVKNFSIKNKWKSALFFVFVSVLEIYLFMFIINNSIFHKIHFNNDLLFIIIFCSLFILFLCRKGLLSKLLENNISVFLGKFSYSIYIMQCVGFVLEKHFMWTNKEFVYAHPYINIWASILICVAIGVVSHIFVEKKAVKAFNALIAKTRSTSGLSGGGGVVFAARKSLYNLRLISPCTA